MTLRGNCFRIIEYTPAYAASLADMWNHSADSWGGSQIVYTEQSIHEEHACSINLAEFLAVDDQDEVIGFCSFSRYFKDSGALFIPLLNVRPDWHGKKVGKALVLAAVERTVRMGWPRLDLFTWPGNTKAVPTYKKCGFFWERRDDTTHLMNFMPTVLQTGLLEPFFAEADWYADAVRDIQIEPDGRPENGFDFYTYAWKHDGSSARAEFEKTGRGLRLVETDDFCVSMELDTHQVVAGRMLPVRFRCVNKSGRPMRVTITGKDDGPVKSRIRLAADIAGTQLLEGCFSAELLPEPQSLMRTHPCVSAEIRVNDRPALLRMGVEIRPPLLLKFRALSAPCYAGERRTGWIDLENCFNEPVAFSLTLPVNNVVHPDVRRLDFSLQPGEKRSVPCPLVIGENGFWSGSAPAEARLASGEKMVFGARFNVLAKGWHGCFAGENDQNWFIVNGRFSWHLGKEGGAGLVRGFAEDTAATVFSCPSLGLPYSNEFNTIRPQRVDAVKQADGSIIQEADFCSTDFPGLVVRAIVRLWPHGELHRTLSVINRTDQPTEHPVHLADHVRHELAGGVLPYDGQFLELADDNETSFSLFEISRFTENWVYAQGLSDSRGLCWHKGVKVTISRGLVFEHKPGILAAGENWHAPAVRLAYGMFARWQDFRSYALGERHLELPDESPTLALIVNDGNPVIWPDAKRTDHAPRQTEQVDVRLTEHKMVNRPVTVKAGWDQAGPEVSLQTELGAEGLALRLPCPEKPVARFNLAIEASDQSFSLKKSCLIPFGDPVCQITTEQEGCRVLRAANGRFSAAISPDFSHALISLCIDGREWLDTSFPRPVPRSWWNSWPGGYACKPDGLQHATLHAAGRTCSFASLLDQHGNHWSGLSCTFTVTDHPRYQGLTMTTYWVMLPGVPLLAQVASVHNATGMLLHDEMLNCELFYRPQPVLEQCWFETEDTAGVLRRYRGGSSNDLAVDQSVMLGAEGISQRLQLITPRRSGRQLPMANNTLIAWMQDQLVTVPDGMTVWSKPVFALLTESMIPEAELAELAGLRLRAKE